MYRAHELRERLRHAVFPGAGGRRYQVVELLGEGGQGWVFKASQDDPATPYVVLKVLRPDLARSEAFARFEREAAVLRAVSSGAAPHPNIVRFLEHGRAQIRVADGASEVAYLVLEFVDGPPLARVLAAHGGFGLPVVRVRRVLRQVARALGDLHAQSIVHRDLKPSNILLANRDAAEIAKVTDFGIVKVVGGAASHTITMAGASAGYAPPEQYEAGNRRVGPPTDVFAFGAILFEALSGHGAFPIAPRDSTLQIVARILGGDRPSLAQTSATIPRELREQPDLTAALDREIARATDADPARRHASIQELWAAVEPLLRAAAGGGARISAAPEAGAGPPSVPPSPAPSGPRSSPQPATSRLLCKPMTGERLCAATFAPDGRGLVAAGSYGLYTFTNGAWSALRTPRGVDPRGVRGLARLPGGDLLLHGDGFAVALRADSRFVSIDPAGGDVTWRGAHACHDGLLLLSGERRSRASGVLALVRGSAEPGARSVVLDVGGAASLHAAVPLAGGAALCCGSHGALFVVEGDHVAEVAWGRTGHLYAAAPARDGGAHVVGSGGHALSVPPWRPGAALAATLEAVQTTRDLTAVVVDGSGVALASGAEGRLLVRRAGAWVRVPIDATNEAIIALAPGPDAREVVALAEDGAVIQVALA